MKVLFITSLNCAFLSLLALLGFSAMTIVPSPNSETWRNQIMLTTATFLIAWLALAYWSRPRPRTTSPSPLLTQSLTLLGSIYSLGVLFFVIA